MVQLEEISAMDMDTQPNPAPAPRAFRILVVDDEEDIRIVLRAFLEEWGYDVIVAEGGPAALRLAQDFPGSIDLLITDVRMPEMDGIELARQIPAIQPEIKVLYMSANIKEMASTGELRPAANIIGKPFPSASLAEMVRHILAS
jgi:two-component system cell cycle sensor histidine kinase/response regulator CckA